LGDGLVSENPTQDFEKAAAGQPGGNFLVEFWQFLRHNKKWWLLPILVILLIFGVLLLLSTTAAAPFIYTLF
jgi:drug/metabolite transporter superfamily protein YnfA